VGASNFADLVVIGCGISGLSCAVSASQARAKVTMLERSTEAEFGGNTRWTESYFRMKSAQEVSDDFEESLVANAGHNIDPNVIEAVSGPYEDWPGYVKAHGMPDPELVSMLSSMAPPTVDWLQSFDVKFEALTTYFMTAKAPRIMPVGGGLALIEALRAAALKLGVRIRYETTATGLSRVDGGYELLANGPQGAVLALRARTVMIASGGFEGSQEMMTQYVGPTARYLRPVARGGYYNKGEGIRLALALGAAPAGDFSSFHAEPLDPRSKRHEALVMNFPYGILVNRHGQRFTDEAPGPVDIHYDHISRRIKDQPDGIAYVVFDTRMDDVPNWKKSIRSDQPPLKADTVEGIARACAISPEGLAATMRTYNAACGKGKFIALEVDGLSTSGAEPVKSNWARPIDQPPYYAYPIIAGVCFTYGGVKTNRHAQVVDNDGRPIPGLYAAGEAAGLYYQVYTGATSVMRGAVFGKIAGAHAAGLVRR
jgi:tricarballylate dehydrogenase